MNQTTTVDAYLSHKGIKHFPAGKEIVAHCCFNDCDKDSKGKEAHLYLDSSNACYQCKKCLAKGNWITLLQHFWDSPDEYQLAGYELPEKIEMKPVRVKNKMTDADVSKYQKSMPTHITSYLHDRGITDEIITSKRLGYWSFYGANWITIPIFDEKGAILFFKLRRDPQGPEGNKYMFYPTGSEAKLYGENHLQNNDEFIVICEGEFDQMILEKNGIVSITSTGWVGTFKDAWVEKLSPLKEIYICFDNDEAGKKWTQALVDKISARYPDKIIYTISIPENCGKDVSELFISGGTIDDIMIRYSERTRGIDYTRFPELKGSDIIEILNLTIKHDNFNKLIVFLAMLSAFTEDSQINVLLNAPSATGKSYIPLQVVDLFPAESVIKILYASQSAFFHESGEYDKEKNEKHIHLERKIIIFIDQPRTDLLARLRPILSHDEKIMVCKITDKTGQWGNQTKNIVIHWYPVAIYCTASCTLDEQEATRFLLISPEIGNEKFRDTIHAKIQNAGDTEEYYQNLESNPERMILRERIELIKNAWIKNILITDTSEVETIFFKDKKDLKPRHQRDVGRFLGLIKAFALLNLPQRRRVGDNIYAEKHDILEATKIWNHIAPWQEHNIAPYVLDIYERVFIPAYREFNKSQTDFITPDHAVWVPRKHILKKHFDVMKRNLSDASWRQDIEPTLVNAGLLVAENIGRSIVLSPTQEIEWYPSSHS